MDDRAIELQALDLERVCSDASAEPIKLTYGLLRFVTKNFSNEIGRGGFGVVYKGTLRDGRVAVKKLSNPHTLPDKQFLGEIMCLKKANHKNIVRFLGYCSETQGELHEFNGENVMAEVQKKLLCFEYVPNGNIRPYIEEKPKGDEWKIRYQIIKGICQGLHYLHEKRIGHLDLKPENVMLDACMEPKITDFGLSRCLAEGQSKVYTTTVCGTLGYIAPEVINTREISLKSDIYALGIIIARLLTGSNDFSLERWDSQRDLVLGMDSKEVRCIADSCTQIHQDDRPTIGEIICRLEKMESMFQESTNDTGTSTNQWKPFPDLLLDMDSQQVRLCASIAYCCTRTNQDHRPTIGEIIRSLEEMELESRLQESRNDTGSSTNQGLNQVSHIAPPSTELLDVYPLELSFPFEAKRQDELQCKVSLINKTDGEVGFFVIPNLGGRIMPDNGILMPRSTSVFALTMSMSRKGEQPLGSPEVLILMFIMRSSDDVRQLMKESVDEDGKLNMPTNDLYKQVKQLGGEIHRKALTAAVHRDTRRPLASFMYSNCVARSTHSRTNCIMSIDAHPTEPWILVGASLEGYIWNWQTNQKIDLNICDPSSVKFIARKQWLVIGEKQSIHVYECPTLDKINKVMKFRVHDSESSVHDSKSSDCYTKLAVHPSRPFVMSYGPDTNSVASMKLWNWEENWSCTQIFDVTSLVLQVVFSTKDTNTFATLSEKDMGVNSVKIWNFGCSMPIATMSEVLEGTKFASVFTDGADQHLITVIGGYCAKIWDLHKEKRVHTLWIHRGDIAAVAFHPKHPVLVTGSSRGTIRVWDRDTYRLKKTYEPDRPRRLGDLAFLESGRLVVHYDKEVGIMDIDVN